MFWSIITAVKLRSGYGIVHQCVMAKSSISIESRCLYALIQSYSGSSGVCWPSVITLSKQMGCAERSIQNWLDELQTNGLLEIERRNGQTNMYHPMVPEEREGVNRDAPLPRTGVHPGGEPVCTQTLTNNITSEPPARKGGAATPPREISPPDEVSGLATDRLMTEDEFQSLMSSVPWRKGSA